ncbi:MAG: RHS repeat-associated core domain-containing protein [Desulfovibrio sp.]
MPLRGQMDRVFRYGSDNRLLQAGDARYEHDNRGFRSRKVTLQGETRYHYAPDYRLLAVELFDGRVVEYTHDDQGLRNAKYVNGRLTERFRWKDRAHLAAWSHVDVAGGQWWEVAYSQDGHPMGLFAHSQDQHAEILLHTDQIGSVRVVEFPTEGMVKEILYDAFGNVVKDGNPYLHSPIGFAGGLHDRDTGLVRFGWRDYDPDTGRFTAKDPIGAAGGDSDWYGYCLDDPVNGRDPKGLNPWYRLMDLGAKAWKYTEPWLDTGTPSAAGLYEVAVNYGKEYADEALEGAKKAGKWYLDTVDKNTHKISENRYGNRDEN